MFVRKRTDNTKKINLSKFLTEIDSENSEDVLPNLEKIFIVHGNEEAAKNAVEKFVKSLNLEPIILHMQPNNGETIIEKLERNSSVVHAIVIYTPCDIASKAITNNIGGPVTFLHRARQNVIFEHGYLTAKIGRDKVTVLVKGEIELPSDIKGIVYIVMDVDGEWKDKIKKEIQSETPN